MTTVRILCIGIAFLISACTSKEAKHDQVKKLYYSVNKSDTAQLNIVLNEKEFYGQYEINYGGLYKDSGDVSGVIKRDTLKGTYRYQHYGTEAWHRIPISLLKKENKLIMGIGVMEIYMNMTFFKKTVPIDYQNPKFVFEQQH